MVGVSDRSAARAARSTLAARLAAEPGVVGIGLARRESDYVVKVDLADAGAARAGAARRRRRPRGDRGRSGVVRPL